MVFSELYSAYYNTVAKIIASIIEGERSEKELQKIVTKHAFGESVMTILPSLVSGRWQLVGEGMTTPIEHIPTMPLTLLEKRWLKAISLDKRIRLFDVSFEGLGLEDVEPLFTEDDYYVYDKYSDGDRYDDEGYVERFRLMLDAIRNKYPLKIKTVNRKGTEINVRVMPKRLEYSAKDDKFRLISVGCRYSATLNLGRIFYCSRYYGTNINDADVPRATEKTVTLIVTDERNALERVMLHFAHFEKQAERIDADRYRLSVKYDASDETELVIRVLSFGPLVMVEEPQSFIELIRNRLIRQKSAEREKIE